MSALAPVRLDMEPGVPRVFVVVAVDVIVAALGFVKRERVGGRMLRAGVTNGILPSPK